MLGSQLMTPLICQVVPYPCLEEDDELKVTNISSAMNFPISPFEDIMGVVSYSDEYID